MALVDPRIAQPGEWTAAWTYAAQLLRMLVEERLQGLAEHMDVLDCAFVDGMERAANLLLAWAQAPVAPSAPSEP